MSLLAPLYIAGILAISLPIIFHLIRRTPQGRQEFSSLMFLQTSPPRITRRSRLSNILLLLLRAAALILLALAFARPFFYRNADATASQSRGRRVAILVDASASMSRGDLWQQAVRQVEDVLSKSSPTDDVALYFFDRQVRTGMSFAEWNESDPARRADILRARLAGVHPTFSATNVGNALATVADLLAETEASPDPTRPADSIARQLILVSDLQQGGHAESLQGHQWPANVSLAVQTVSLKDPTNASVQIVHEASESASDAEERKIRVRVANQADSQRDQFALAWANSNGPLPGIEPLKVYVPAGRSQMVRMTLPPVEQSTDRLMLTGDDCDFDNTIYFVPPRQEVVQIVYLGDDAADDVKGLRYYLERVVAPTAQRKLELIARESNAPLNEPELAGVRLIVVAGAQSADRITRLRQFIEKGGDVLWVMTDEASSRGLTELSQAGNLDISEAPNSNFSLIARTATDHPLFAPFADARFADFTKIHFWKHRRLRVPDPSPIHAIAWFDDGDPFLLEQLVGKGRLLIATSGWQPADSQLALSTKFVPLIDGMLRRHNGPAIQAQYLVDDPIPQFPQIPTDHPGIYHPLAEGENATIAVNLAPDESRTTPLAVEELEQWGAKLGNKPVSDELVARQRQLQVEQLENQQKLWRWLIVAVLGILIAETVLAGRLARRTLTPAAA